MKHGAEVFFFIREYLFPAGCAVCRAPLNSRGEAWQGICEHCRAQIERIPFSGERCRKCGKPLVSGLGECLQCRDRAEGSIDQTLALFPYIGKCRALLRAYKFGKGVSLANFFAEKIQEALESPIWEPALDNAALVPVPPRPGKIKAGGWDQIEQLAKTLERRQGRAQPAVVRCLRRLPSKVQKELAREDRLQNLQGRFRLVKPPPKTAVILDDITTTGSTLEACAATLKNGGAERVCGLCLFYD